MSDTLCTCTKDPEITCMIHPHNLTEGDRVMTEIQMPSRSLYTPREWDKLLIDQQRMKIDELGDKLKWAYCKEKGADSIIGLDSCDDYRDWLKGLE